MPILMLMQALCKILINIITQSIIREEKMMMIIKLISLIIKAFYCLKHRKRSFLERQVLMLNKHNRISMCWTKPAIFNKKEVFRPNKSLIKESMIAKITLRLYLSNRGSLMTDFKYWMETIMPNNGRIIT